MATRTIDVLICSVIDKMISKSRYKEKWISEDFLHNIFSLEDPTLTTFNISKTKIRQILIWCFSTTIYDFTTTNGTVFSYKANNPNWKNVIFHDQKSQNPTNSMSKILQIPCFIWINFFDDVNVCPSKKKINIHCKELNMRRAKKNICVFTSTGQKTAQALTDFWKSADARKLFDIEYMDQSVRKYLKRKYKYS